MLKNSLTAFVIILLVTSCATRPDVTKTNKDTHAKVTAIAAGLFNTCALRSDGIVKCWGTRPSTPSGWSSAPDTEREIPTALAAGGGTVCDVFSNGMVQCWGDNEVGQLGGGTVNEYSALPIKVRGIDSAKAVAVGMAHACSVLSDGSIMCWGNNSRGQLGNGLTTDSAVPVAVTGISNAKAVMAGFYHSCALLLDGSIQCWGNNEFGQLGSVSAAYSPTPVTVKEISDAIAITSGGCAHTCALFSNGTMKCWGNNKYAQLGTGNSDVYSKPVTVIHISKAIAAAAGVGHTCAVLSDGSVKCWGQGLGVPTAWDSIVPLPVAGIRTAIAVTAGRNHSCALLREGRVVCWGSNVFGMLGNQNFKYLHSYFPVEVDGL